MFVGQCGSMKTMGSGIELAVLYGRCGIINTVSWDIKLTMLVGVRSVGRLLLRWRDDIVLQHGTV